MGRGVWVETSHEAAQGLFMACQPSGLRCLRVCCQKKVKLSGVTGSLKTERTSLVLPVQNQKHRLNFDELAEALS